MRMQEPYSSWRLDFAARIDSDGIHVGSLSSSPNVKKMLPHDSNAGRRPIDVSLSSVACRSTGGDSQDSARRFRARAFTGA